jgi:hypothetical protein
MRLLFEILAFLFLVLLEHATTVAGAYAEASDFVVSAQPPVHSPYQLVQEDADEAPASEQPRPTFQELTALYAPQPEVEAVIPEKTPPTPSPQQPAPYSIPKMKYVAGIWGYAFMRMKLFLSELYYLMRISSFPLLMIGCILVIVAAVYICRYRRSIQQRLSEMNDLSMTDLMVRVKDPKDGMAKFKVLDLNPEFRKKHEKEWKLVSMGEYLSTLRPKGLPDGVDAPKAVQREMERYLGSLLIGYLGPRMGSAVLPMLGFSNIETTTARVAARVANWFASHFIINVATAEDSDPTLDKGIIPISLYELSAFANINEQFGSGTMKMSPLELMKHGEVGYSPSFDKELIPNPFTVERHWDRALRLMEASMNEQSLHSPTVAGAESTSETVEFDPYDKSLPKPKPLNQRLFPDLHFGWGDAECTHTKREIIRNRLFCVLLNKLSHNYYNMEQGRKEKFTVLMEGKTITSASAFVEALINSGHEIEVVPRGNFTTFGQAACVKEEDGSFTNIPIAYFLRTGYENEQAQPAHVAIPHGGMCLVINGPLVGKSEKCNIQFYMAIEGMCGWNSNHNADVPWVVPVASTEPYRGEDTLRAVRTASLIAVTFNAIGTEMNLPFGGYGVLGVCNDTAALLDQSIRGKTNMYPLVSTGRFLMHTAKRLGILRKNLLKHPDLKEEVEDILRMVAATMDIPSDLHASPSNVLNASKRYLSCQGEIAVFQIEEESKKIIGNTLKKFEDYLEKRPEMEKGWKWKKSMRSKRKLFVS